MPNPAHSITTIGFQLPAEQNVRLTVYNAAGQLVKTLVDGHLASGSHQVIWNATDETGKSVAGGVYFYRLTAGAQDRTGKLVVTK
jgi:flagellar hook assembly protein FlgD